MCLFELELSTVFEERHLFPLAQYFAQESGTAFLFSGGAFPLSRQSTLAIFPYSQIHIEAEVQTLSFRKQGQTQIRHQNPWEALKFFLSDTKEASDRPDWIGYLSYEMGAYSDWEFTLKHKPTTFPLAYFQRHAVRLVFNHITKKSTLIIDKRAHHYLDETQLEWLGRLQSIENWPTLLNEILAFSPKEAFTKVEVESPLNPQLFYSQIQKAKALIAEGIIYQVNLSQKIRLRARHNPFSLFKKLMECNPVPFAAYLDLPFGHILSTSPELFLCKQDSTIFTEPIKGTVGRGRTPAEDQTNRSDLLQSTKENAELLMIADLMRSDLGRFSQPGSVECLPNWNCHAYQNVFHLSASIRAILQDKWHFLDALRSCFPGGSITGCPKIKAMEVINALEEESRDVYTGSIGYFTSSGNFNFNIAIRSLVIQQDLMQISLGAGIVEDSDSEKEFQELLHKGKSFFHVLGLSESHFVNT